MNSDIFVKVVLAVAETFGFFFIGVLAVMRKMVTRESLPGFSRFAINVLTPFLVFSSVAGKFSREDLCTAWIYPAAGFLMIALHALFGYMLLPFFTSRKPERRATFLHMAAMNNYVYLPIIIIGHLWPGKAVAALLLWSVGSTLGQWTIGIGVMAVNDVKKLCKNLLSPNTFAVLLGIAALLLPWRIPAAVMNFCGRIGDLAIPLCLILIGSSLWLSRKGWGNCPGELAYTTVVRLIIIPLLTLLLLNFIPLPEIARNIAYVLAVMPVSCASVLIVQEYGGDGDFAGQIVLSSTLFGLLTMPLLLALFL